MNRDDRSSSNDPTAERTADQSTQSASGLSSGMTNRRHDDRELRPGEVLYTPRRYEQPIEDDDDPVMPGDESTVNTKI